jgi:hypothetical protein
MSAVKPMVLDGGINRQLSIGDILSLMEPPIPATDTTNTTLALTAAMLLNSTCYARNPAGVSTDTLPTADALITAMIAGMGLIGVEKNFSFRWKMINLSANVITVAAPSNAGVTLVRGTVAAGAAGSAAGSKDFLIQITNGTPLITTTNISSTNANAVLTGFTSAQIAAMSIGQVVTNAIAGQQGNTIIGINAASLSVTMSGNSNTTATGQTFTFSPTYTATGLSL